MALKIPDDAVCAISGCPEPVTHLLSLRMRRRDTGADWAPNLPVYLCDDHSVRGAKVTIIYEPTRTGRVETTVFTPKTKFERTTRITKG